MFRNGIRMVDLLDPNVFEEKQKGYLFSKKLLKEPFQKFDTSIMKF